MFKYTVRVKVRKVKSLSTPGGHIGGAEVKLHSFLSFALGGGER